MLIKKRIHPRFRTERGHKNAWYLVGEEDGYET